MKMVVVVDNVRSAHNVGSLFRTCDGAGVAKLYLCGYTPAPVDRFGRPQPEIEKTSLGAEKTLDWEVVDATEECIDRLKEEGFTIVAVEQHARAATYFEWRPPGPTAFIFGNEVEGVQKAAIDAADEVIEIPMYGAKESLNVAVAAGVILFHFA